MRASRLLRILMLLQMRGRMSADALADEFEVSVRTIYRDIDQLSAAGVPVFAERGRAGGFQLMDGYRTNVTGMTPGEAETLLLAGLGPVAGDLGLGANLAAAELKLMAALPADAGARAAKISARFYLDPVDWYRQSEAIDALPLLADAVWRDRIVSVVYESWKDVVIRELRPLGLVLKAGVWYLVAAVERGVRTYRVSNIRSLDVTDRTFARPAKFDLARHWAARAREFEAGLLRERAVLKVTEQALKALAALSPAAMASANASRRPTKPTGWFRIEIPIESAAHATGQILSLGADVEVLEPPALRTEVAAAARAIVRLYAT